MDYLPQKKSSGTKALRALFESKVTLQQSFNSSPRLNSATDRNTERDCPLQDWRSHNTPLKKTIVQVCDLNTNFHTIYFMTVLSVAILDSLYPRVKAPAYS